MSPTPTSSPPERGVERIRAAFAAALTQDRAAFMPYQMLGHPTPEMSPLVIEALAAAGASSYDLALWLRQHKRTKVHPTTVWRALKHWRLPQV